MTKAHALFLEVASQLRALARDPETTWSFGSYVGPDGFTHAEEEMVWDGIDYNDVKYVVKSCKVTDAELDGDEWRYRAEGPNTEGIPLVFILSFSIEEKWIEIVTAWRLRFDR